MLRDGVTLLLLLLLLLLLQQISFGSFRWADDVDYFWVRNFALDDRAPAKVSELFTIFDFVR